MTRGKIIFMFAGLCVVAILLWIASMMKQPPPAEQGVSTTEPPAAGTSAAGATPAVPGVTGDFYITGHVNRSGMFTLRDGETIKEAVKDAGGADSSASDLVVPRVVRKDDQGTSTRSISLADIESGQADEKVARGDIITLVQQAKPATLQVPPAIGGSTQTPSDTGTTVPPATGGGMP